ncbi:O-antigen ligase family protein [Haladaptatus salinisoli]|uniref:O-antigen ligase family protein n=1 Tax=Haladaptatus salinisoli TaxID=2884876 RepID=UPI001D0B5274|nr:O-antigen ligase family protein [Haladaptatus salinisoli]
MTLGEQRTPSTTLPVNPFRRELLPLVLVQLFLVPLLFADVLLRATNRPEWVSAFHLNLLYVLFAPVLLFAYAYYRPDRNLWLHVAQLAILILLTFALLRQEYKYIPPADEGRTIHVAILYLYYLAYPLLGYDLVSFFRERAVYIAAYATVLGVYFFHVDGMAAGSGKARFVVMVALIFGMNLFFIPRHVSRDVFLWALSLAATFAVGLGLPAYLFGEYQVSWLQMRLFAAEFTAPLLGVKLHYLQSIFANPNTLGGLAFAGAFAALVLAGEAARRRSFAVVPIAGAMFLLNGIGVYASYSRASWLALALASTVYASYLAFDRRTVAYATVALGALTVLFFAGMFLSVVPIDPHGRFALWRGGLGAVLHAPSPFGYGVVAEDQVIAPFVPDANFRGYSPHNSYMVIFLNTGIVGGLAYLVLTLGSIAEGLFRYETVDVPMLGFAVGFSVHHLFEAYTMFNIAVASVVSALVFGYLICGYRR